MRDYRPFAAQVIDRLRGPRDLMASATERVELAPATDDVDPPAIQLDDEMDRHIALAEGIAPEEFQWRMAGGPISHPATFGYRFADAVVADGVVYTKNGFEVIGVGRKGPIMVGRREELSDSLVVTNQVVEQYFGHWLTDGLSLELLAGELDKKPLGLARLPWDQEPGYRSIVGLDIRRTEHAHVRNLWIVDDRSMNASRVARMAALRKRVRRTVAQTPAGPPCFLMRVGGASRILANQMDLADGLARRGFRIIIPEAEPVAGLVAALAGASLVVSVEGSALCHGVVAMRDHGTILAIQPPARVNWIQKAWCDCARLRFAQAAADPAGESFTMSEDRLMRLVDRIDHTVR